MCAKYDYYANYPRVFCGAAFAPYIVRARGVRGERSSRVQRMETKGLPAISTTQRALAFVYKRSFISGM